MLLVDPVLLVLRVVPCTGFLVAAEVAEHAEHTTARETLARLVAAGDQVAVAPQLLAEFIHVVTDPRRFA